MAGVGYTARREVIDLLSSDVGVVINGVTWATRNVDAPGIFADTPESFGMLYQWNRKIGWSSIDLTVNSNGGINWDDSVPVGTVWKKASDPSPVGWRVPTSNEIMSLLDVNSVSNEWATYNGVYGRKFIDKTTGNSIFLPAAGCRYGDDGAFGSAGLYGGYWSGTQNDSVFAYALYFRTVSAGKYYYDRRYGLSIRCVAK